MKIKLNKWTIISVLGWLIYFMFFISFMIALSACSKKTATFESVSTHDSSAVVTLPTRSTSIITQPCDSLGLRPFELVQVVGRDTIKLIGYRDRIVTEYVTMGDTSTKVEKSESEKSETKETTEVVPDWAWWLLAFNGLQLIWWAIRKRVFTFLNRH